ncbi:GNVR domain-containing protein [Cyclobacterium xiamenense]|jgi:LPS O-antigen subunit length determinant protein (WzzB/FepE family)|uniref:GNVR domain-containing protein n=1 Tax=Cyclobacterium xiamenense TaxID=1297121 RepID=UPI0035D00246
MKETNRASSRSNDEIDILALAKTVWRQRKKVLSIVIGFVLLGLFIAIFSPKDFTASSTFVPQTADSNKAAGSLGGLASLAGINLGAMGGGAEIPPTLYPKIVSSVTFRKALLAAEFNVEGVDEPVSYREYFEEIHSPGLLAWLKKYTVGLPGVIVKALRAKPDTTVVQSEQGLIRVSQEEFEHFKRLENQLSVVPNDKEGFVTLSFVLPEPLMAAQMSRFAQQLLQQEVIAYKISNAREQLKFTEERYLEKKKEFEEVQAKLANFKDRNQNIASATVQNQLQRLEADYNFSFNIYNELAKQLEQARLQVAKDTPIFSVIQPVTVPTEKSGPKRLLILIIFTFLGIVLGLGYIFGSEFLRSMKEQWESFEG